MKRLLSLVLFLLFVEDKGDAYTKDLGAPLEWLYDILLDPTPIKLRPFDLLVLGVLVTGWFTKPKRAPQVAPMRAMLFVVLGTTVFWFLFGLLKGGEVRFASWQTYLILSNVLLAFTMAATFETAADFHALGSLLVAAALYKGAMCWVSYFTWGRHRVGASGTFLTDHDDTVTWVVSILILVVQTIDRRKLGIALRNGALCLFFLGAIQFNSRRLAWVSLAMAIAVTYALFPQGIAKKRIRRLALIAAPLVLLYVVVGWGRQNAIFLPLRSLASVSTQEDGSTLARNAENLGLIATANYANWLFGSGWGRPYVYLTLKYDIGGFELWRYIPHNSILGILAFTGIIGFAGFWLAFPTAVFLNARVARLAKDPKAKNVAIVGAAQMIVCANQLYGDMGIFFLKTMYVLGISYAIALRLPCAAGVWPVANPKAATRG